MEYLCYPSMCCCVDYIFIVVFIDDDTINVDELVVVWFIHSFAVNGWCSYRSRVMLNLAANQSRIILCTEPGTHNVDAPFWIYSRLPYASKRVHCNMKIERKKMHHIETGVFGQRISFHLPERWNFIQKCVEHSYIAFDWYMICFDFLFYCRHTNVEKSLNFSIAPNTIPFCIHTIKGNRKTGKMLNHQFLNMRE